MIGSTGTATLYTGADPYVATTQEQFARASAELQQFADDVRAEDPGAVLVRGTEDEIAVMATKVRLGDREQKRRASRKKMQKASRAANRP